MIEMKSLNLEEAKTAVEAMLQAATEQPGQPVGMAVVDSRGELISFARMDGANSFNQKIAIRKAYTAAVVGVDTGLFGQFLPSLNMNITDFGEIDISIVPGGVCVRTADGATILGGIGVSGRVAQEDEALCKVGAAAALNQ